MKTLRFVALALALALVGAPALAQQATTTLATAQVSVAATATKVADTRPTRSTVIIVNGATTDVFCGGSAVTTTTGVLLPGTKGATLTLKTSAPVYCIVATSTETVSVAEVY